MPNVRKREKEAVKRIIGMIIRYILSQVNLLDLLLRTSHVSLNKDVVKAGKKKNRLKPASWCRYICHSNNTPPSTMAIPPLLPPASYNITVLVVITPRLRAEGVALKRYFCIPWFEVVSDVACGAPFDSIFFLFHLLVFVVPFSRLLSLIYLRFDLIWFDSVTLFSLIVSFFFLFFYPIFSSFCSVLSCRFCLLTPTHPNRSWRSRLKRPSPKRRPRGTLSQRKTTATERRFSTLFSWLTSASSTRWDGTHLTLVKWTLHIRQDPVVASFQEPPEFPTIYSKAHHLFVTFWLATSNTPDFIDAIKSSFRNRYCTLYSSNFQILNLPGSRTKRGPHRYS